MAEYKKTSNGRYMVDGKLATASSVPPNVREQLDTVDSGTALDENGEDISGDEDIESAPGGTKDEEDDDNTEDETLEDPETEDEETNEDQPAESAATPVKSRLNRQSRMASKTGVSVTPESTPGMGFPMVKGKTVDIFDGKTPHTHVKNVDGIMVPLSEDSYNNKTDTQIMKQLDRMGI